MKEKKQAVYPHYILQGKEVRAAERPAPSHAPLRAMQDVSWPLWAWGRNPAALAQSSREQGSLRGAATHITICPSRHTTLLQFMQFCTGAIPGRVQAGGSTTHAAQGAT